MKHVAWLVSALLLASCNGTATGPAPTTQVEILTGDHQVGAAGFELADPIEVRVVDANGMPVAGAVVHWNTQDRDAVLTPTVSSTDAQGIASTRWQLGRDDGGQVVSATFSNLPAARFHAEARSGQVGHAGGSLQHQCGRFADDVVRCWATPADGPADAVAIETDLRFASLGFAVDRWCGSTRDGVIACVQETALSPGGVFRPDAASMDIVSIGAPVFARIVGAGAPESVINWCGQAAIDQSVWCWGRNDVGQLGNGVIGGSSDAPVRVVGDLRVVSIAVTSDAACAVDVQGIAKCWGSPAMGVVDGATPSATPVVVPTARRFAQVAADATGSVCGVADDALMYCWGSNANGGRGRNGIGASSVPTAIEGTDLYVAVTAGSDGFLALTIDRTLVTWGGLTGTSFLASPVRVLPGHVFGEVFPGGGTGVACVRAYPDGSRCVDRVGLVRALAAPPTRSVIYGVPGN